MNLKKFLTLSAYILIVEGGFISLYFYADSLSQEMLDYGWFLGKLAVMASLIFPVVIFIEWINKDINEKPSTGYYIIETNERFERAIVWFDADKEHFSIHGSNETFSLDTTLFDRISLSPLNLDDANLESKESFHKVLRNLESE